MGLNKMDNILFRAFLPKIKDVMTRNFPTLNGDIPVIEAFKAVIDDNVNAVVIEKEGKPVGILTRRDLIDRCFFQNVDCEKRTVEDFMSHPVITIDANENVIDAYEMMMQKGIRRLVVLEQAKIVGIITLSEIQHLATATPGTAIYRIGYFIFGILVTITIIVIILAL